MWRDLKRLCEDQGLPFRKPEPFPQNSLLPARVAVAGMDQGWGEAFSVAVYRAQFADGQRIDDPATLNAILTSLKIDAKAALDVAQSDANKLRLRTETEEAQRLGVFGAPTFVTASGELFWGNDRLEQAVRWVKKGV
jgi:2-hydroxychromene-2-carboxylate isomerase